MKETKDDPLAAERIKMENLGRIFIFFLFVALILVGHFLLNF